MEPKPLVSQSDGGDSWEHICVAERECSGEGPVEGHLGLRASTMKVGRSGHELSIGPRLEKDSPSVLA